MAQKKVVKSPAIKIQFMNLILVGDSPLVCHAWSEKAKKIMADDQDPEKVKPPRTKRDKIAEYQASMYHLPNGKHGFPSIAFKSSAVRAAKNVEGMTMADTRNAFHVQGELVEIKGKPEMREDMIRVKTGGADLRYRGGFNEWEVEITVRFNSSVISAEKIVNLFNLAGFGVGVGEYRPEKNGSWGLFHVKTEKE